MSWPAVVATVAFMAGGGFVVGGVYVLWGLGWALLACAPPCFLLSAIILRGLLS